MSKHTTNITADFTQLMENMNNGKYPTDDTKYIEPAIGIGKEPSPVEGGPDPLKNAETYTEWLKKLMPLSEANVNTKSYTEDMRKIMHLEPEAPYVYSEASAKMVEDFTQLMKNAENEKHPTDDTKYMESIIGIGKKPSPVEGGLDPLKSAETYTEWLKKLMPLSEANVNTKSYTEDMRKIMNLEPEAPYVYSEASAKMVEDFTQLMKNAENEKHPTDDTKYMESIIGIGKKPSPEAYIERLRNLIPPSESMETNAEWLKSMPLKPESYIDHNHEGVSMATLPSGSDLELITKTIGDHHEG